MEPYIVSARKYRPTTFSAVVGQSALTSTLKNAIATDRLAHAYLFCGSRGVGKTSCARIFAKTINCLSPTADGEACNECASCQAFNAGGSFNILELDAASNNSVDDIRGLIEQVQTPPTEGKYKVVIVDEVHMLSNAAFNAFLKTLEEPPSHVVFILATTEKQKIIPTILSRCQIYDFNRIGVKDIAGHLAEVARNEGITAEESALTVIARKADGAMRDALSIFDQVAAFCRGNITYADTIANLNELDNSYYLRLMEAFEKQDVASALVIFHEIRSKGFDAHFFINGLGEYLRSLMLASNTATLRLLDEPEDVATAMAAQAGRLKPEFLYRAMGLCNDADLNYRQASNKQLLIELTLIRIAQLLSPSPADSGRGEGPLQPIKKSAAAQATPAPTPASPAAAAVVQPQSVPLAQPTPAPRQATYTGPAPSISAPRRRSGGTAMQSGLIPSSGGIRTASQQQSTVQASHQPTAVEIDPAVLQTVWQSFAREHASQPALNSLMTKAAPTRTPAGEWVLVVDSAVSGQLITAQLDTLVPYLRRGVGADDFTFRIEVCDNGLPPEFWSERKVLDYLLEKTAFKEFYSNLYLSLL